MEMNINGIASKIYSIAIGFKTTATQIGEMQTKIIEIAINIYELALGINELAI